MSRPSPATVAASFNLLHTIHVDSAQETTDPGVLHARTRIAFEDVARLARHDPTAAGHLARATRGVIAARELELAQMRHDQDTGTRAWLDTRAHRTTTTHLRVVAS